ncbi:Pyruvate-formate lyase-activating enzyme (PflA) (PDB:3CAN) [Commensalibacter communis]|uniref:Pyruvate formate-lyase-activating enzyme n=1 Tax=Commensalibacter communis TaxID=2972786 RepID=A0A9W4TPA1_9PROT|nr:pyruvate formate lyase 1-activating protein [Commensalibacter communis]CAI3939481.1 Pyruvate-formate lyase-activating enzyme (PflA) (PDB:3CAN) [Commensalibacter communis]CAI3940872.1 Pyruvate-formate lyase-activating enzyme (PflA) (PDB:3CAN) [Commensalibacter communis]CAI3942610.1 Pyruvate-formate lyase-activating enzyme (PflA) (PDB:3CAN) [Commensalibacter communis]CAI3947142.1 Pyruvate-formate lyase-activating enzyme (PflA) (PDB:3CAN) [Commensalibacter communis]
MSAELITGRIHSVESFGTVDGDGIRFIVFVQGCLMQCLYCHNPDALDIKGGKIVTVPELMKEIVTYKPFLQPNGGGVTASGGEAVLQAKFVTELFKAVHQEQLTTCLDTNGYVGEYNQDIVNLVNESDLVMLDLKQMNDDIHRKLTGISNQYAKKFAKYLHQQNQRTWIRYVIVPGWTDDDESAHLLGQFTKEMDNVERIEMLPFHQMGANKWKTLGKEYKLEGVEPPSAETLKRLQSILASYGHKVIY